VLAFFAISAETSIAIVVLLFKFVVRVSSKPLMDETVIEERTATEAIAVGLPTVPWSVVTRLAQPTALPEMLNSPLPEPTASSARSTVVKIAPEIPVEEPLIPDKISIAAATATLFPLMSVIMFVKESLVTRALPVKLTTEDFSSFIVGPMFNTLLLLNSTRRCIDEIS